MSANNYLKIDRKNFTVADCDAETGSGFNIGKGETLEEALDIAQKYQKGNIIEYGIQFVGKSKGKYVE